MPLPAPSPLRFLPARREVELHRPLLPWAVVADVPQLTVEEAGAQHQADGVEPQVGALLLRLRQVRDAILRLLVALAVPEEGQSGGGLPESMGGELENARRAVCVGTRLTSAVAGDTEPAVHTSG